MCCCMCSWQEKPALTAREEKEHVHGRRPSDTLLLIKRGF